MYAHFRIRWNRSREEAEDLTQDFFEWVMESPLLDRADPARGRFRNFVRAHLDNFMRNHRRAERRQKRGGDKRILSLDFGDSPDVAVNESKHVAPEDVLDHQWRQVVMERAVAAVRGTLREVEFEVLRRYDLSEPRPTYAELAAALQVKPSDIDNHLSKARKALYDAVRAVVAESVDGPETLRDELDAFFKK